MHADWAIERTADALRPDGWTRRREIRSISRALARLPSGSTVLSIPSPSECWLEVFVKRAFRLTCADSSESALEGAWRRWQKIAEHMNSNAPEPSFVLAESLPTSFADRHFDTVVCAGFFDRLDTSERRIEALNELRRVSRGTVVVSFCNAFALGSVPLRLRRDQSASVSRRHVPVPVWAFLNDLRRAGLNPVDRHSVLWGISPLWHIVSMPMPGRSSSFLPARPLRVAKAA
jgi:hypothetical protein